MKKVSWNFFGKFIVDKNGNCILPKSDEEVENIVDKLLNDK